MDGDDIDDDGEFSDEDDETSEQPRTSDPIRQTIKEIARKLWIAVEVGDKMATLMILQSEAEGVSIEAVINCQNSDGWAPLHVAASEGHTNIIEILLEYGALADSRTKNFRTPLHIACVRGHFGVIQTLLMAGADADAKDINGNTPTHFTAEYGHKECLRFLLTRHPTLFAKNSEGKSSIDLACNQEILQTFEEYIKSVKNLLYTKKQLVNKKDTHDQSLSSNDSGSRKLHVDEVTLKQRATNKQIKIHDSGVRVSRGHRISHPEDSKTMDTFTQKPQPTFSSTSSQSQDEDKIGPHSFIPIKLLGSGSFGEVYLVKEIKT